jgi:hypothetical protein
MECKAQPGLYFIGEVVDVTGWLGGYNFQWAWASACLRAGAASRLKFAGNRAIIFGFAGNSPVGQILVTDGETAVHGFEARSSRKPSAAHFGKH